MGNRANRRLFKGLGYTERLTGHPQIAYYLYPDRICAGPAAVAIFVVDQLLVATSLAEDKTFHKRLSQRAEYIDADVFDGEKGIPHRDNVQIWRLKKAAGRQKHADVAEAVWHLREHLPAEALPAMVAPNHVLIPAGNLHQCPWGPPEENGPVELYDRISPLVDVAVIDSGYMCASPIAPLIPAPAWGEWLQEVPTIAGAPAYQWVPGSESPPGIADALDQNNDGRLDAVAGHANFVAGVVAQGCPNANIVVESLTATFLNSVPDFPGFVTEAAVARCLWDRRGATVINVGYAYATLPDQALSELDIDPDTASGPPSWALQVVIDSISSDHVIVAPAGNQDCVIRQYPAAFSLSRKNVVGVGSVVAGGGARSDFSNHGKWVSCCTEGENVTSAFVEGWYDKPTEEGEPTALVPPQNWPHPNKTFEGWARWNGTSFAAPKVSAKIAQMVADSISAGAPITATDAWEQLRAGGPTPGLDMGTLLEGLPPV